VAVTATGAPWWQRGATWPLRHPWATVAAAAIVTLAAALGWPHVRLEPDVARMLPRDHPQVAIAELLDERSRPSRALWLLLRGERVAERVPAVAAALRASPLVTAVDATRTELLGDAAAAAAAPLWSLDQEQLRQLEQALSPDGIERAVAGLRADLADDPIAARELAVRDPLGVRWVFAANDLARQLGVRADGEHVVFGDGGAALLRVTGATDAYDAEFAVQLMAHVDRALAAAGVAADVFGGYAVARSDRARITADFQRAGLWSAVAIAAYLVWAMRGIRLPLLVQLPAAMSIVWAVPFAGWLLGPLPTVAVAAVAVLCGLGVDFAIHYAARYREARLQLPHARAIELVQARTVPELLIDMATTAVTFVAVGFGQRGGLSAFGWLLALGLVASVLLTSTVLPVLLRFAGDRRDPERSWLAAAADRWLQRRAARPVAGALVALAALAAAGVAWHGVPLRADGDLRPADDATVAARQRIEATVGFGTVPLLVLWPVDADASPLWARLHELQREGRVRFWSGLGRADTVAGVADVLRFRDRTAGFAGLARRELAAAGFDVEPFAPALDELAASFAREPERTGAAASPPVVAIDGRRQRVVTVWPAVQPDARAAATFANELQQRAGGTATVHGSATLTAALEQMLRGDLLRACLWAAALALVMVTAWLRSLRAGLLALLPSACGLVATLVFGVVTGLPLSLTSFVAVPFVLGIGVDEGVHTVGQFRHGALVTGATGVGVVRTSAGTALGFGALLLAASPGLAHLGLFVVVGSLASMLACLFVLAPLLRGRPPATLGP
jgi:predicted RND superfamily exporter protein